MILSAIFLVSLLSFSSAYTLVEDWEPDNFFDNVGFYNGADPTNGYVYYTTQQQAEEWGYTYVSNNQVYIRADDTSISSGSGRGSVRISSNNVYQRGLFIFDVQHMPFGCGTWPAIWTANLDTWPYGGEIDILEGVNNNDNNQMTLHTAPGCTFPVTQWDESGVPVSGDCGANGGSSGCAIEDYDSWSYGTNFNNNNGGVWAMQWEASGIYIWLWARDWIPADITAKQPTLENWGTPRGTFPFGEGCDTSYFYNHHIIIDLTFCGDWAGSTFASQCGGDCDSYVQYNPSDFDDAYWVFNSVQVYQ